MSGGHMRDILPVVVDGLWRQGAKIWPFVW